MIVCFCVCPSDIVSELCPFFERHEILSARYLENYESLDLETSLGMMSKLPD